MHTETVNLKENSYPIFIGEGLTNSPVFVADYIVGNDVLIVTNEVVAPLYLEKITKLFDDKNCLSYVLPDGEQQKKLKTVHKIIDFLLGAGFGRDSTLVSLGGGVVGDITGFTASVFMRGVSFIQIPTTLLAQVDASVGGKTGVNHALGKNLIGSFYQPRCVVCDSQFLPSLTKKDYLCGLSEVIKYGLIKDADFFEWLENNVSEIIALEPDTIHQMIQKSCKIKADIVSQDEKEHSVRALLNFGHTFGHAIEASHGFGKWHHGEAVAVGMVLASRLSLMMSWITENDVVRIRTLLAAFDLPLELPDVSFEQLTNAIQKDKKIENKNIQLVLLRSIGEAVLTADYPKDQLDRLLRIEG
jgi:3-dehydroquinate synthase